MVESQLSKYKDMESEIMRFYGDKYPQFKNGDLIQMVQKMLTENMNMKETLE